MVAANIAGNDTTLSAQQIKESENLRRLSKAREPSTKIDESPTDKKSTVIPIKKSGEHIRPLTAQPVTPAIQVKEPKEIDNKSVSDARKSSAFLPPSSSSAVKKADGKKFSYPIPLIPVLEIMLKNATPMVVSAYNPAFNSYFSQGLPGQRAEGRPQTSDAAKRMMMNPLIKSTSPRFKINSKASQLPMPNYHGIKPNMEVVGNGIKSGVESRHKNSIAEDTPDSKDIKKDASDSVEQAVIDESKKRVQTQGSSFSNEIRIRPVSAHIMKRMHNNLNQITENAKEPKPASNVGAAMGINNRPVATSAAEEADKEKEKPKNVSVERPKSAVFVGRLGPKPVQFNREQVDNVVKNFKISDGMGWSQKQLSGGWMQSNPSSTATSEKVKGFGDKSKKESNFICKNCNLTNLVEVLREVGEDSDIEDEKSMMFRRSGVGFMRFEYLAKPGAHNTIGVIKKPETSLDWNDDSKQIRPANRINVRPMTSIASKKRLTIHDLM